MNEPLSQLLFSPSPIVSSLSSSQSAVLSTHSISHPIDLIISDMLIHMPIRVAHEKNIMAQFFVPSSLMILMNFIHSSMGDVNSILEQNFAYQIIQALSLANGLICNSFHQLEIEAFNELHRQLSFNSHLPIRFVIPLISDELDEKQNVSSLIKFNIFFFICLL